MGAFTFVVELLRAPFFFEIARRMQKVNPVADSTAAQMVF
jgi:hypothetical protein